MAENKLRFTDEEIHKANNIDIMDYAIKKGLELNKVGRDSYRPSGLRASFLFVRLRLQIDEIRGFTPYFID